MPGKAKYGYCSIYTRSLLTSFKAWSFYFYYITLCFRNGLACVSRAEKIKETGLRFHATGTTFLVALDILLMKCSLDRNRLKYMDLFQKLPLVSSVLIGS